MAGPSLIQLVKDTYVPETWPAHFKALPVLALFWFFATVGWGLYYDQLGRSAGGGFSPSGLGDEDLFELQWHFVFSCGFLMCYTVFCMWDLSARAQAFHAGLALYAIMASGFGVQTFSNQYDGAENVCKEGEDDVVDFLGDGFWMQVCVGAPMQIVGNIFAFFALVAFWMLFTRSHSSMGTNVGRPWLLGLTAVEFLGWLVYVGGLAQFRDAQPNNFPDEDIFLAYLPLVFGLLGVIAQVCWAMFYTKPGMFKAALVLHAISCHGLGFALGFAGYFSQQDFCEGALRKAAEAAIGNQFLRAYCDYTEIMFAGGIIYFIAVFFSFFFGTYILAGGSIRRIFDRVSASLPQPSPAAGGSGAGAGAGARAGAGAGAGASAARRGEQEIQMAPMAGEEQPPGYNADVLPEGWERKVNDKGRIYYVDHIHKTTHWELPPPA